MIYPINHHLLKDIKHGFFTRNGGVSTGLYNGLNVGLGSNDDVNNITKNRQMVLEFFAGETLQTTFQIHSDKVTVIDSANSIWSDENSPECDGIVCNQKGVVIGALSADCGTVLFADTENQVIGACHAGWRGAKANIMKVVIDKMITLGAVRKNIVAVIGPLIAQNSYEVGYEFYQSFIDDDDFNKKYFRQQYEGQYFDLNTFIYDKIKAENIGDVDSIYDVHQTDTYTDEQNFYSFRRATHRGEEDYGRQISAICL